MQQMIIVTRETIDRNQPPAQLALFMPDGTPVDMAIFKEIVQQTAEEIIPAVADLTERLETAEATIADLVSRVEALEGA